MYSVCLLRCPPALHAHLYLNCLPSPPLTDVQVVFRWRIRWSNTKTWRATAVVTSPLARKNAKCKLASPHRWHSPVEAACTITSTHFFPLFFRWWAIFHVPSCNCEYRKNAFSSRSVTQCRCHVSHRYEEAVLWQCWQLRQNYCVLENYRVVWGGWWSQETFHFSFYPDAHVLLHVTKTPAIFQ